MWATRVLMQHRQPMIKFLGKRHIPKTVDHSPHVHPAAPEQNLPESFAQYRNRAIQHGPLGGQRSRQSAPSAPSAAASHASSPSGGSIAEPYGAIGGHTGKQLGSVQPTKGEAWDRNELPARFRRRPFTEAEMEAVESGGASLWA